MYKVIDGVVYKEVDVATVMEAVNCAVEAAKPYVAGIETCREQIDRLNKQIGTYEEQVQQIVIDTKLDLALVKLIAPDKAAYLNLT